MEKLPVTKAQHFKQSYQSHCLSICFLKEKKEKKESKEGNKN